MSSPFQRAFSSKSPLKETGYRDPESKDHPSGSTEYGHKQTRRQPAFIPTQPESNRSSAIGSGASTMTRASQKPNQKKKPSIMDVATGPMQSSGAARLLWETGKKIYKAIDTPQERTAMKNKVKEAWNIFKGPRSTKVGN